jgi:hypothetical protein
MRTQARRESSRAWIASGAAVTIKTYARRYGVDRYTACQDLTAIGFPAAGLRPAVGAPATSAAPPASLRHPTTAPGRQLDHDGRAAVLRRGVHRGRGSVRHLPRGDGRRLPDRDDHPSQTRQAIRPGSIEAQRQRLRDIRRYNEVVSFALDDDLARRAGLAAAGKPVEIPDVSQAWDRALAPLQEILRVR